jgi:hypothetical protein
MKKLLILLLLISPSLLFAYEHSGGVRLDLNVEAPELYGTIAEASSENQLSLWYEGRVNDLINISVDGGLVYEAFAGVAVNLNQEIAFLGVEGDFYPDIRSLNVFGYTGIFDYRVGRQVYTDPSGMIISHPVDGLDAGIRLGPGVLKASIGYSGLVHNMASDIAMTKNDITKKEDSMFGASRLIEGISYTYPELLDSYMSLTAGITAQQDLLKDENVLSGAEKMNSVYLQLGMEGFLLPWMMYDSNMAYQIGKYGDLQSNGFMADLQLFLVPGGMNSYMSLSALMSTGETWGNREDYYGTGASGDQNQFVPISTAGSQGYVLQLDLGNVCAYELLFSFSKTQKFSFELSTTTLMRFVDGPVSSSMLIEGSDSLFIGQEGLMAFKFRPVSDFGASIKLGALYPGEAITINEYLEPYLPVLPKIGFDLSFSF